MNWIDIVSVVFVCVTANHLGLVKAIEGVFKREIPIANCIKCSTFWAVLAYTIISSRDIFTSLAISFLASYTAIWLELLEGYIDTLYLKLYGKIIATSNNDTSATDSNGGNTAGTVS